MTDLEKENWIYATKKALQVILKKGITHNSTRYDLFYDNECFPPKEVYREAIMIMEEEFPEIPIPTLGGGKPTNNFFIKLGFEIVEKNDIPSINGSKLQPQIKKYNKALQTDWFNVHEHYKFNFVKWIIQHIDFEKDSVQEIKERIEESQEQKYEQNSSIKGINFLTSIKRYHDDYITEKDIYTLKKIAKGDLEFNEKTSPFSFKSYPKTSLFLSFFAPTEFCPYDAESLISYEFLKSYPESIPPKRGFKAFQFYQTYYQFVRANLEQSHIDSAFFKEVFEVDELTDLHWNWITQDFLLFIARNIMNTNTPSENIIMEDQINNTPLNQILFGAPGTGKTYNTKKLSVEIIDGHSYDDKEREEILERYEELKADNQIHFTTFHQSISYEDFIEGIKPVINNEEEEDESNTVSNTISYEIKDGIFKSICNTAKGIDGSTESDEALSFDGKRFYKMSLGGKRRQDIHNWSIANDLIFMGWGGDNDFSKYNSIKDWKTFKDKFKEEFPDIVADSKYVIQAIFIFQKMNIGDVVVVSKGNKIIDAIGIIESDYFYDDTMEQDIYHFRKVKWLAKDINASPELFIKKAISQQTIYEFNPSDVKIDAFEESFIESNEVKKEKRYVLIIDEINRGNVSSIFGELITLLEEDKRKGNDEALSVVLPYSNDDFSVPNNVYIIGTMNTADRSVEALDTALRRRFSFVEMKSNPKLLETAHDNNGMIESKEGQINLIQLLETINERIELLIDKDHQIGHSFVINTLTVEELKKVFKNKILPLLEEYFYGDFGKIGLVLGKAFVQSKSNESKDIFAQFDGYEDRGLLAEKAVYEITNCDNLTTQDFISIYE